MEDSADSAAAADGFSAHSPANSAVKDCGKKIEDFRRTMQRAMSTTGPRGTSTVNRSGTSMEGCKRMIQKAMTTPKFMHLREQMAKLGCNVGDNFIRPINCRGSHAGHYRRGEGISACCNNLRLQDYVSQMLIHEMIHAYDDCRANVNWRNCAHHACAEIRANHVSGDCHYMREFLRGNWKLKDVERDCVKRRSLESVRKNPYCSGAIANNAVDAVWDICYNDTAPWDSVP